VNGVLVSEVISIGHNILASVASGALGWSDYSPSVMVMAG
jgi:hypothetical protein